MILYLVIMVDGLKFAFLKLPLRAHKISHESDTVVEKRPQLLLLAVQHEQISMIGLKIFKLSTISDRINANDGFYFYLYSNTKCVREQHKKVNAINNKFDMRLRQQEKSLAI